MRKDARKLAHWVEAQPGWRVEKRKHQWRCFSPDGRTVVGVPSSPSDVRSIRNARAALKRAGLDPGA